MKHIYGKHNYTVLIYSVDLWTIWVLGASTSLSSWKSIYNCRTSPLDPRFHIHRFSQFQLCSTMVVVQLLSHFRLSATPWTVAFQSLLKRMSFESVMLSNHLILCHPLLLQSLPASGAFPMSPLFASGGQSIRESASASVLPGNVQGWFPLGLIALISVQSKSLLQHQGMLRVGFL